MAIDFWRVSHDDYASEYYTSACKAYNAMIANGREDEFGDENMYSAPTMREAKNGVVQYGGWSISKETAY